MADGWEAARAILMALERARIDADAIGYVNAHATSTPVGDAAEMAALGTVFAGGGKGPPIGSTKSATGHMRGTAGAMEAVFSVLGLPLVLPVGPGR